MPAVVSRCLLGASVPVCPFVRVYSNMLYVFAVAQVCATVAAFDATMGSSYGAAFKNVVT